MLMSYYILDSERSHVLMCVFLDSEWNDERIEIVMTDIPSPLRIVFLIQ